VDRVLLRSYVLPGATSLEQKGKKRGNERVFSPHSEDRQQAVGVAFQKYFRHCGERNCNAPCLSYPFF